MKSVRLPDNFYESISSRLDGRIGRELRLARRVLDLGCGSCGLVQYLAETYHQRVTGVDISDRSFPKRARRPDGRKLRCIRKDGRHLDFLEDGSHDAVVTMRALHEMHRPDGILKEALRILRPGGEILIVDFPRGSLAQKLWDEDYYRPEEVESLLEAAGFVEVRARLIERKQIIWAKGFREAAGNISA